MIDTSYHIAIWIGIGIGIGIGKIFSPVLGIESIGKKWYRSSFSYGPPLVTSDTLLQHNKLLRF